MGKKGPRGGKKEGGEEKRAGGFRVPAFLALPGCILVCWAFADWPGAIFGAVAGFFLWRSRA